MNAITDIDTTKLSTAFDLVNPAIKMAEMAQRDPRLASWAAKASWKDEIADLVSDETLAAAGVTIEDVREAIEFYTATEAKITREQIGGEHGVHYDPPKPGYLVIAKGYRKGPAGP
jgi:hypothetical protein